MVHTRMKARDIVEDGLFNFCCFDVLFRRILWQFWLRAKQSLMKHEDAFCGLLSQGQKNHVPPPHLKMVEFWTKMLNPNYQIV